MGNCLSKYLVQKRKLESFLQHIILNGSLDFTSPEIQDIKDAVHTLLERIRARVNNRGFFNITRIVHTRLVLCPRKPQYGSMMITRNHI